MTSHSLPTTQFAFATCQLGAEPAVKEEFARDDRGFRLAFSRPGFMTFKSCGEPLTVGTPGVASYFARAQGLILGKVAGEKLGENAKQLWELPAVAELSSLCDILDLHIWQRDGARPGWRGFQPGPTTLSACIEQAVRQHAPLVQKGVRSLLPERPEGCFAQKTPDPFLPQHVPAKPSPTDAFVLDVILVEPDQWWIGCHRADRWITRWPGGVIPVDVPADALSRAYGKMAEALAWSRLPITAGDTIVELGCAPGGVSQALLDRGLTVIGVDPAEVDPSLLDEPNFTHVRKRAAEVRRRLLRGVRWLAADMNVAPRYTLDAVESLVTHTEVNLHGLILTLKLPDWKLAAEIPNDIERIRGWGYHDVRARQLGLAGQELCVVALRSRSSRRSRRKGTHAKARRRKGKQKE